LCWTRRGTANLRRAPNGMHCILSPFSCADANLYLLLYVQLRNTRSHRALLHPSPLSAISTFILPRFVRFRLRCKRCEQWRSGRCCVWLGGSVGHKQPGVSGLCDSHFISSVESEARRHVVVCRCVGRCALCDISLYLLLKMQDVVEVVFER
jgi:hypothetical protein